MKKYFAKILPLFMLFATAILSQYLFDQSAGKNTKASPLVLPSCVVKAFDLGLDSAASDLVWLETIQYFGSAQNDGYQKMSSYIHLVNDLDPSFSYPYAFGALMLPVINQVDQSIDIAKRGIKEADPDWRIPYYLAVTYHIYKNDQKKASKYFDLSANTAGAPDNIKMVAAQYGSREDLRQKTLLIWESIYKNSEDEVVKERAKAYIIHLKILSLLDEGAKSYQKKLGRWPQNVSDLIQAKIISQTPQDPFGFDFFFDKEGKTRVKIRR